MIHTFRHTFKNKEKITLKVDFSGPKLRLVSTHVPEGCNQEFQNWRNNVVMPAISEMASPEQIKHIVVGVLKNMPV